MVSIVEYVTAQLQVELMGCRLVSRRGKTFALATSHLPPHSKDPSFAWRSTIELVDIECVLGDVSGVQILPL